MSRRILLADDSVTIQKVIELTFMDDDYEVRAVGNGDEALAMLTALTVDFVIADVHMPGASGYEVCRRSKQLRPEVPVLLLVGTFEPFDEAQARESGANSYLKKPFDSQELLGRVHDLLGPAAAAAAQAAGTAGAAGAPLPAGAAASAVAAPAGEAPAAAGAGAGAGTDLAMITQTGGIEAAGSWQEFELEAEPELVADPWPDAPPAPPAAAKVPPAAMPFEQQFALGDLDEPAAAAEPAPVAAPAAPAPPEDAAHPATPDWLPPAAPAPPAVAGAAEPVGRPFTLGEPLDDRVLLDQALAQDGEDGEDGEKEHAQERTVAPAASGVADERGLRATQEEPMVRFGAVPRPSRPAAEPPPAPGIPATPAPPQTPAMAAAPATGAILERAEQRPAVAAGNGQPASPPISAAAAAGAAALGDQDVDRIARRVVELIGDKVVRDIAWEVIPDLAEVVIKDRLRELESQIE